MHTHSPSFSLPHLCLPGPTKPVTFHLPTLPIPMIREGKLKRVPLERVMGVEGPWSLRSLQSVLPYIIKENAVKKAPLLTNHDS